MRTLVAMVAVYLVMCLVAVPFLSGFGSAELMVWLVVLVVAEVVTYRRMRAPKQP